MSLFVLSALSVGCSQRGTTVLVELTAGEQIDAVAKIGLLAEAAGVQRQYDIAPPSPSIPPAISIAIQVPPSISGTFRAEVDALDATGTTIARAAGEVPLAAGVLARLPLSLVGSTGGNTDLGEPGDFGGAIDQATAPPVLVFLPTSKDFGPLNEGMATAPFEFTVQNTGVATGAVTASLAGMHAAEFKIDTDSCTGLALAPLAICKVNVSFHPAGAGSRVAALVVSDGAQGGMAELGGAAVGTNGKRCTVGQNCQTGNCVDQFCCDQPAAQCTGCNACNVATKEGTCSPVPVATDPRGFCTQSCADKCDGAGGCRPRSAGVVCKTDPCTNLSPGNRQFGSSSDGIHQCDGTTFICPAATGMCPSFRTCNTATGQCKTACAGDLDCRLGSYCSGGQCIMSGGFGAPCGRDAMCGTSNICVGGACRACANNRECTASGGGFVCTGGACTLCTSNPNTCVGSGFGNVCSGDICYGCNSSSDCLWDTAPSCVIPFSDNIKRCACVSSNGQTCRSWEMCVGTGAAATCKTRSGNTCVASSECVSGSCVNSVCQ